MADARDIFALLLIVLYMENAQDSDDSGLQNINSVVLILLLVGLFNTRGSACSDS